MKIDGEPAFDSKSAIAEQYRKNVEKAGEDFLKYEIV